MRPGDPPFAQVEHTRPPLEDEDDEPEFDYPAPEKKKQPPQMNLLKRSVGRWGETFFDRSFFFHFINKRFVLNKAQDFSQRNQRISLVGSTLFCFQFRMYLSIPLIFRSVQPV